MGLDMGSFRTGTLMDSYGYAGPRALTGGTAQLRSATSLFSLANARNEKKPISSLLKHAQVTQIRVSAGS